MDVAVLKDARSDLGSRLAQARALGLTAEGWIDELVGLENRYSPSVVEGMLEYYADNVLDPEHIAALYDSIEFYIDSLREYKTFHSYGVSEGTYEGR